MTVYHDPLYHQKNLNHSAFLPADLWLLFAGVISCIWRIERAKATAVNRGGREKLMNQSKALLSQLATTTRTQTVGKIKCLSRRLRMEMKMMILHISDRMTTVHSKFKSRLLGTGRKVNLDRMPVNNLEHSLLIHDFLFGCFSYKITAVYLVIS